MIPHYNYPLLAITGVLGILLLTTCILCNKSSSSNTTFYLYNRNGDLIPNDEFEYSEQQLLSANIKDGDRLLQLGGNIGTSCIIAAKTADLQSNVCVEPNHDLVPLMQNNIITNDVDDRVQVVDKIIANTCTDLRMELADNHNGEAGFVSSQGTGPKVNCISLRDVQNQYNHGKKFNVLFADCEGCLPSFIEENQQDLDQVSLLIYERDRSDAVDYTKVDEFIQKQGLQCEGNFHIVCKK